MMVSKNNSKKATLSCAIYTRKSSEEGLEQDFNSLHAQREACEAFIQSQEHEGWVINRNHYDDGGVSGATLERPALQHLLDEIKAGHIDVVVVYKVDRLTRSLTDFAKLVELFDTHNVSFVSVTQQFNTTTSMGRLTLNVLLSFAQFEREVTGERIRDKIAASKQKGMWMGGYPPLGYDVKDRKLVVNESEADTVRYIYTRYAELGSVRSLKGVLDAEGIVSKVRHSQSGRISGGQSLGRGALYRILKNRLYLGEITHNGDSYPGQHDAIVSMDLWDQVQILLQSHRVKWKNGDSVQHPSLLVGLLFDDHGHRMTPTHSVKNTKRYRYYVSKPLITETGNHVLGGRRLPAGEIEHLVLSRIQAALADQGTVLEAIQSHIHEAAEQQRLLKSARALSHKLKELTVPELRALLRALIVGIDILSKRVDIHLNRDRVAEILLTDPKTLSPATTCTDKPNRLILSVPAKLKRVGMGTKMIINAPDGHGQRSEPDVSLIKLIAKAHRLNNKLINSNGASLATIAKREGLTGSYFTRVVRLSFLSPDITRAILDGRHPPDLTAAKLTRLSKLPLNWDQQKALLGFV